MFILYTTTYLTKPYYWRTARHEVGDLLFLLLYLANTEYSVSSCKWFVKGHDPSLIRSEIQLLLTQNSWADTFLVMNRRYSSIWLSSLFFFCRSKISCWPECQKMPQSQWFVKTFLRLLDLSEKRPSNSILILHWVLLHPYTIKMVTIGNQLHTVDVWFTKRFFFQNH